MSKQDAELQEILTRFVSNFAERDDEGNWWGLDTNVGDQSLAFSVAKRSIKAFKVRHLKASGKKYIHYKDFGYMNRPAIAKAVWGNNIPGWWRGSTAEFNVLESIARAKS